MSIWGTKGKRVLHAISTLEGGGAERQLTYLASGLVRQGWEVHVACLRAGVNFERLRQSGATIHVLPHVSSLDPSVFFRLGALCARIRPAVVQSWLHLMDTHMGLWSIITGIPWVMTERNSAGNYAQFSWRWVVRERLGRHADAIVANSVTGLEYWSKHKAKVNTHLAVIRNVVPVDEIESQQPICNAIKHIEPNRPMILYAGRLETPKNICKLLDALALVIGRTESVVVICGQGSLYAEVSERLCALQQGGRCLLLGYVENLWQWIRRADVFVSVSLYEGCPNTVLECMAGACPLVVSDIPAHKEILDESSAIFVDPDSADAIAEGVVRAINDRPGACARARRARQMVERWSQESIAHEYAAVYASLMSGRN